jgi:hypothetical protein
MTKPTTVDELIAMLEPYRGTGLPVVLAIGSAEDSEDPITVTFLTDPNFTLESGHQTYLGDIDYLRIEIVEEEI